MPFVGIYNKNFPQKHTARKTAIVKLYVGHWSQCSMRLVVSNTSELFGKFTEIECQNMHDL